MILWDHWLVGWLPWHHHRQESWRFKSGGLYVDGYMIVKILSQPLLAHIGGYRDLFEHVQIPHSQQSMINGFSTSNDEGSEGRCWVASLIMTSSILIDDVNYHFEYLWGLHRDTIHSWIQLAISKSLWLVVSAMCILCLFILPSQIRSCHVNAFNMFEREMNMLKFDECFAILYRVIWHLRTAEYAFSNTWHILYINIINNFVF